jgi:uncharacterized protein (TIGR03083 family)
MSDNTPVPAAYRASIKAAYSEIADLVAGVHDFSVPGLGTWDLGGLTGHFLRSARTTLGYLAEPEPPGPALPGAAHYSAAYLERRDDASSGLDQAVAVRGSEELAGDDRHPAEVIRAEADRLDVALAAAPAHRLVATPFGPLRLSDYLRTRVMEMTVHGIDIARAIGTAWSPPEALLVDTLALLSEIALLRGAAVDLICVLTGRTPPEPAEVLPILR